jgi:predicted nucleic acid-binding Zn ribbon protein
MAKPERISSILERLVSRMGISTRLEQEKAVILWEEAVGRNIARRAQAVSFKSGRLFVVVETSMWLQELALMKEGLIEKLNTLLGKPVVEDIMFRIGDPDEERRKERPDGGETQPQGRRGQR